MALIVFICTGNMCRSPMAEGIFRARLNELGQTRFNVSSMGIHGQEKQKATQSAIEVCAEHGVDISEHIARGLVPEELKDADWIFVMEPVHKDFLRVFFPRVFERTFLLGSWPEPDHKKGLIKDPIGGSKKEYQKTFELIEKNINRIIPHLLEKYQ